jgi:hypothetical protein
MSMKAKLLAMCEDISEEKCRKALTFAVKQSDRNEPYVFTETTLHNILTHIVNLEGRGP